MIGLDTHALPSSQKYMDDSRLDKVVGFPLVQGGGCRQLKGTHPNRFSALKPLHYIIPIKFTIRHVGAQ
jgi:hypothetical protein